MNIHPPTFRVPSRHTYPYTHPCIASIDLALLSQKELKKLAKAQGQSLVQAAAGPNTPSGLPATPGVAPPRTSTPQPGVPKPPPPLQQPSQARGLTPVGIGTPQSVSTPISQQQPTPAARGVKREREDTGLQMSGNVPQGAYGQDGAKSELRGTKAGTAGVRPRPIKKARLVRHLPFSLARLSPWIANSSDRF